MELKTQAPALQMKHHAIPARRLTPQEAARTQSVLSGKFVPDAEDKQQDEGKTLNTKVINGRLHIMGADGNYAPVPLGMDEARSAKQTYSGARRLPEGGEEMLVAESEEKSIDGAEMDM